MDAQRGKYQNVDRMLEETKPLPVELDRYISEKWYAVYTGSVAKCEYVDFFIKNFIDTSFSDAKVVSFFVYSLFKYDVFHFYFGRSTLLNAELLIYDLLRKKYFFEFHGSDIRDYNIFCSRNDIQLPDKFKMSNIKRKRNEMICKKTRQVTLHDDELIEYLPEGHAPVQVVPLRVDIDQFEPIFPKIDFEKKLRWFVLQATDHLNAQNMWFLLLMN